MTTSAMLAWSVAEPSMKATRPERFRLAALSRLRAMSGPWMSIPAPRAPGAAARTRSSNSPQPVSPLGGKRSVERQTSAPAKARRVSHEVHCTERPLLYWTQAGLAQGDHDGFGRRRTDSAKAAQDLAPRAGMPRRHHRSRLADESGGSPAPIAVGDVAPDRGDRTGNGHRGS